MAGSLSAQEAYSQAELRGDRYRHVNLTESNVFSQQPHLEIEQRSGAAVNIVALGSSGNVYTMLNDHQNMVSYDADLDGIAFTHRINTSGGNSGGCGFDRSVDGGATFVNNLFTTPGFEAGSFADVSGNRYPSVAIWNPPGNTDPTNTYVGITGPGLSVATASWGYTMAQSANMDDGSDVSEAYVSSTPGQLTDWLTASIVVNQGTKEFWSIGGTLGNATAPTVSNYDFVNINRGVFNTTTNQIDWTLGYEQLTPNYAMTMSDGAPANMATTGWSIGFSPDGNTGYAVFIGALTTSVTQTPQPIIYKSTDAGSTWNLLPSADLTALTEITDYLVGTGPTQTGPVLPYFSSVDCVVDDNGRLHMFNSILPRSNASADSALFIWIGAGIEGLFHTSVSDGTDWTAKLIDSVLTDNDFNAAVVGGIDHAVRTNISRSQDGSKIFFTWSASDPELVQYNELPNVRIRGYDTDDDVYTFTREPSAGTAVDGSVFWPTAAPYTRDSGSDWDYEIPIAFTVPTGSDLDQTDHFYMGGVGFNDDEFGLLAPPATADFSFAVTDNVVAFTNLSFDSYSYIWDFGDGSPLSGLTNPTHTFDDLGTYNVCLTAQNDGSPATDDTSCKDVEITSLPDGINDPQLDAAIELFPNPSKGLVNITVDGYSNLTVEVFNLLGEQVLPIRTLNGTMQLDLTGMANGTYLVKVTGESGVSTRTVTISH
jgi:hypothetical protein